MKLDKEQFKAEVKELLKTEGKEELMEFVEDTVELSWKVVKLLAKHTDMAWDDMAVSMMDSTVLALIDKIHEEK